jgi:hypothetical protein
MEQKAEQKVLFFENNEALLCDIFSDDGKFIEAGVVNGVWYTVLNRDTNEVFSSRSKDDIGEENFVGYKTIIDEIPVEHKKLEEYAEHHDCETITIQTILDWADELRNQNQNQLEFT